MEEYTTMNGNSEVMLKRCLRVIIASYDAGSDSSLYTLQIRGEQLTVTRAEEVCTPSILSYAALDQYMTLALLASSSVTPCPATRRKSSTRVIINSFCLRV